jgi:hypothetical protein
MLERGEYSLAAVGADEDRVAATRESQETVAAASPNSTEHLSIFNDISDKEAWRDFAYDYSDTFYEYLGKL